MTFNGRFFCDTDGPQTTFVVTIDGFSILFAAHPADMIAIANRFPYDPEGCNCTNCMTNVTYGTQPPWTDLSEYKYNQDNTLQVTLVVNDICLSYVVLTLYYEPGAAESLDYY